MEFFPKDRTTLHFFWSSVVLFPPFFFFSFLLRFSFSFGIEFLKAFISGYIYVIINDKLVIYNMCKSTHTWFPILRSIFASSLGNNVTQISAFTRAGLSLAPFNFVNLIPTNTSSRSAYFFFFFFPAKRLTSCFSYREGGNNSNVNNADNFLQTKAG